MGKKKVESTQKNDYGYIPAQITPQIQAVMDMKAQADPTIPFRYANLKKEADNSFNNPLGAYTTPAVRDAANRVNTERFAMDEAQANQESQFQADNTNYGRALTNANLSAPKFVQTGGSSTQTQSGGFLGDLAIGLASGASGAATSKFGGPAKLIGAAGHTAASGGSGAHG